MVRAPCCEKMGLKKGPWSQEEDQILISYIQEYGHGNWRALPKQAGLLRCGKSCRLRWSNYLRPDIKRGNFTKEEEQTIIDLHEMLGNRWSAIAARLPGRTDNEIKNVWHTHLKKRLKNHQPFQNTKSRPIFPNSKHDPKILEYSTSTTSEQNIVTSPHHHSSEMSSVTNSSCMENPATKNEEMDYSSEYLPQIDESFWSEELSTDDAKCSTKLIDEELKFPTNDMKSHEDIMESKYNDSMDFWYNVFIGAGDMPELPEF